MSISQMQDFKVFMFQQISESLTPNDVEHLVYTQGLLTSDLTASGIKVLMKLETEQKRFSVSNLKPLAEILRNINRNDLAEKVNEFHKSQRKKDHKAMDQKGQVAANIEAIKLQAKILLEKTEELENTATKFGLSEVVRDIKEAVAIINPFQKKLKQASSKLSQLRQERAYFSDSSSSSTCSDEDLPTSSRGYHQPCAEAMSKNNNLQRVPEQTNQQTEEAGLRDYEYSYVTHDHENTCSYQKKTVKSRRYYRKTGHIPQSREDIGKGEMVTGKDCPGWSKQKPPVASKPAKLQQSRSNSLLDTDYTGGSADTSTGDSGFVDSTKFRKDCPPRPLPRHMYQPLKADQREAVSSYATFFPRDEVSNVVCHEDENLYVNTVNR